MQEIPLKRLISTSEMIRLRTRIYAMFFFVLICVTFPPLQSILIALFWLIEYLNAAKIGAPFKKKKKTTESECEAVEFDCLC